MNYEKIGNELLIQEAVYKSAKKEKLKLKLQLKNIKKELSEWEQCIAFTMEIAKESQQQNKEYIESVVSSALQTIFGKNFSFVIEIEEKYDQQQIKFFMDKGDGILRSPRDIQVCGGELNVIVLGLRPAIWSLNPDAVPILMIDEPLKDLSQEYIPIAGQIINQLSEKYNLQFIIITHIEQLVKYGHNIIEIGV